MAEFETTQEHGQGLRAQNRKERRKRIADAALELFRTHGYEQTTIDAIAAHAEISRRSFFHYFKTKDEILLSMQDGFGAMIVLALRDQPDEKGPYRAVHDAMVDLAGQYTSQNLLELDRVMMASEAVRARKQASYIEEEAKVLAALRQRWPDQDEYQLRVLAMLSIGLTRVALDRWRDQQGSREMVDVLKDVFAALGRLSD